MRPYLAVDVLVLGGKVGMLLIRNVGRGPALDVNLEIVFEFAGGPDRRRWSESSIEPGESHQLRLPNPFLGNINAAADQDLLAVVRGSMRDVDTLVIDVDEQVDISAWYRQAVEAEVRVRGRRKIPGVDPMSGDTD